MSSNKKEKQKSRWQEGDEAFLISTFNQLQVDGFTRKEVSASFTVK
jgi:hypothetical protein